jgi:protein-S-isoprenylcysteine O-methyltransferase Ste14
LLATIGLVLLFPNLKLIHPPFTYLGIPLIVLGVYLIFKVDSLLKKKQTTVKPFGKPTTFIIEGPFRFSRHPMYLGFIAWFAGFAILLGNLLAFLTPIATLITLDKIFIPQEEKNLEKAFGKKFQDYQKRVCRWLGKKSK